MSKPQSPTSLISGGAITERQQFSGKKKKQSSPISALNDLSMKHSRSTHDQGPYIDRVPICDVEAIKIGEGKLFQTNPASPITEITAEILTQHDGDQKTLDGTESE